MNKHSVGCIWWNMASALASHFVLSGNAKWMKSYWFYLFVGLSSGWKLTAFAIFRLTCCISNALWNLSCEIFWLWCCFCDPFTKREREKQTVKFCSVSQQNDHRRVLFATRPRCIKAVPETWCFLTSINFVKCIGKIKDEAGEQQREWETSVAFLYSRTEPREGCWL